MTLPTHVSDREYQKFEDTVDGPAVRTKIAGGTFSGTFTSSGLQNAGRISEVSINNLTWTALPAVALTDRNAIGIQNYSGQEVKLQFDNLTVGYVGIIMQNSSERFYDIKDSIPIYAKSSTSSCTLIIEELS